MRKEPSHETPTHDVGHTPTLAMPGLLVMDVDSTLIDEEIIDQLGEAAGCGARIADITERAMNGELEFREALRARVGLLRGLPADALDAVYRSLHVTDGAVELIDTLHRHGWKVGVVSGGFHEIIDRLAENLGIDYRLANRLGISDGRLTGEVVGTIVRSTAKLQALEDWAARCAVGMEQTVAVGDGANDIPMIQAAGLGIAFCAKPKTRLAADRVINERDLARVLEYLA